MRQRMNKITFSHKYDKLNKASNTAILLGAQSAIVGNLDKEFLKYDTSYWDFKLGWQNYDLSRLKNVLILYFYSNNSVFTTIRRWTPQKEDYYKSKIGETFEIVIKEAENE